MTDVLLFSGMATFFLVYFLSPIPFNIAMEVIENGKITVSGAIISLLPGANIMSASKKLYGNSLSFVSLSYLTLLIGLILRLIAPIVKSLALAQLSIYLLIGGFVAYAVASSACLYRLKNRRGFNVIAGPGLLIGGFGMLSILAYAKRLHEVIKSEKKA